MKKWKKTTIISIKLPPPQNSQPVNNTGYQPSAQYIAEEAIKADRKRRRKKRRIIFGVIIGIIVILFVIASLGSSGSSEEDDVNNIGYYYVEVADSKVVQDYNGDNVLIVTYNYTNNSSNAISFDMAFITHAYQNGVEIEKCYSEYSIEDDFDYDSIDNNLQPGVTSTVQEAFYVSDMSTDVEIEIGLFLGLGEDNDLSFTVQLN